MKTNQALEAHDSHLPHEFSPPAHLKSVAFFELCELLTEYWARVDRLSAKPVADLYTLDGVMQIGALHKSGQLEIAQFFDERNEAEIQKQRSTRHALSNVRVEWVNAGRVIVLSLVVAYAAIGEFPQAGVTAPATIADFSDICTRDADGDWKIESKKARILFAGAGAANFVR